MSGNSEVIRAFRPLFQPRSIAVAGASATGISAGNRFIRLLREHAFPGEIYPIHPTADEIEGIKAYRSIAETPQTVDYAYLTVPAGRVRNVLEGARGRLSYAQVMASGEDEAGAWERELKSLAVAGGFRVIGPNCMGIHSPRGRFTFMEGALMEQGGVGIASQSGGLGMDILRRGQNIGLRFSGLVTIGNSVDVQPSDLLEYYLADQDTQVVGLYLEDVKDGRRFQELARANRRGKPVVILVGGLTQLGRSAAASHTGALAGTSRAWQALARQTGIILTESLDSFLDALQMCLWLEPKPKRIAEKLPVTLFGNGGGTSVLATDMLDRAGFALATTTREAMAEYAEIKLPPGASLANPIDLPASVLQQDEGRVAAQILKITKRRVHSYALIVHLNLPVIMGYRHVPGFLPNLAESVLGAAPASPQDPHLVVVLRSDRSAEAEDWRRTFLKLAFGNGVPTFDEIPQAVAALAQFNVYESFLARGTEWSALVESDAA